MRKMIELESGCGKCSDEMAADTLTQVEATDRLIQNLAVISDYQIAVDIYCRIHGAGFLTLIPHVKTN